MCRYVLVIWRAAWRILCHFSRVQGKIGRLTTELREIIVPYFFAQYYVSFTYSIKSLLDVEELMTELEVLLC